jgi:hypothetical protein
VLESVSRRGYRSVTLPTRRKSFTSAAKRADNRYSIGFPKDPSKKIYPNATKQIIRLLSHGSLEKVADLRDDGPVPYTVNRW